MSDGAKKFDSGKPNFCAVPPKALWEVAKGMTHGADKYGMFNYLQSPGLPYSRTIAAAYRHIGQFWSGEDIDADSGINHLALAVCELMMTLEGLLNSSAKDDRFYVQEETTKEVREVGKGVWPYYSKGSLPESKL